jgi:cytidine deaminase
VTDDKTLLAAAVAARGGAYAPYSNFPVGAALLGRDGRIWTGANIENASYGLSMCAERNAVFAAVAAGARAFDAVAVTGPDGMTTMPCGACRQVLWEFAPELRVVFAADGAVTSVPLAELLPAAFGPAQLEEAAR